MSKEVKGHSFARNTLTVTYTDDATEKFYEVTDEQHEQFLRSGRNDNPDSKSFGEVIHKTAKEQGEFLGTLRAK